MGKKKKKYFGPWDNFSNNETGHLPPNIQNAELVPEQMLCDIYSPGLYLGTGSEYGRNKYIGMPQGAEGNILIAGGNGSGKSASIAKPTLQTWQGAICVTDIKGELSELYKDLYQKGLVTRPYIIFNPLQDEGIGYDPFYLLEKDKDQDLISHIWQLALAIIPAQPDDHQPFWVETEQGILAAYLLFYFRKGISFSETTSLIMVSTTSELVQSVLDEGCEDEKMFLGELTSAKPEVLANFDRGLRNKLMLFATDPYICNAFRGKREGADCFNWDDLDRYNIFLRIPAERIEQWGGAINLMYTQLIRHFERRPDKYDPEGRNNIQTLLLLDEFARFGKLDMITSAMSTLRSKNVNICLIIQSIAQLDKIYGEYDRRIILDNCQFQAILRANDPETQKYFSELIGTTKGIQRSIGETLKKSWETVGYSRQINEILEYRIQPHELSTLQDILLLTPYGFCRAKKAQPGSGVLEELQPPIPLVAHATACKLNDDEKRTEESKNIHCRVLTTEETAALNRRLSYASYRREN